MKLIYFYLLLLLIFSCSERSKTKNPIDSNDTYYTEISGNINGILSVSNSPYLATNEIVIDSLEILQIDPGVTIHFTDSSNMLIRGGLNAIGTKDEMINFSAQNNSWKGIEFSSADQNSIIQFSIIENVILSYDDSTEWGALQITNSNIIIKNCIFRDNEAVNGAGISVLNGKAEISNNIFRRNKALVHGAGIISYASQSKIINNTFYNNFSVNCGAAISLLIPINDIVQNNIMFNNLSQGICEQFYYNILDSLNYTIDYNFVEKNEPDPRFAQTSELRLLSDSPCRDAGNPDPQYNDSDGSRNDQGAYGGPDGNW